MNVKIFRYVLNKDISLNIPLICFKFSVQVDEEQLERRANYTLKDMVRWRKISSFISYIVC